MAHLSAGARAHRLRIGLFALLLFLIAVVNFSRNAGMTTDENLFRNPPSRLHIVRTFPVASEAALYEEGTPRTDSIRVGDLLTKIDGKRVETLADVQRLLDASESSQLHVGVFKTDEDRTFTGQVARESLPDSFVTQLPPAVYVFKIDHGGASEMAGMRVGDLIYKINGQSFGNAREADVILKRGESGRSLSYDIVRKNKRIKLDITLARIGFRLSVAACFLTGLLGWLVGVFFLLKRPDHAAARILALAFISLGFFVMVVLLQQDDPATPFAQLRFVLMVFALNFGLAFWVAKKFYFPRARHDMASQVWLRRSLYLIAAFFSAIFISLRFQATPSGVIAAIAAWGLVIAMAGMSLYLHFGKKVEECKEYRKLCKTLAGISIATVCLSFLIAYLISSRDPQQIGFSFVPLALIPLSYLYTIGRYQIIEIDLHLRRNIQYILVTSVWVLGLILVLLKLIVLLPNLDIDIPNIRFSGTSFMVMDTAPDPELHEFWQRLIVIFAALALSLIFWKVARIGQRLIDRKFNRLQYDLSRASGELAEIMATKIGMTELSRGIIQKLARFMELKSVGILLFNEECVCCGYEASGVDVATWEHLCLRTSEKLVAEINRFRSESRFTIEYLAVDLKEDFQNNGFQHVIPIRFKDKLVGTLVIGEKLSESPLHLEDLTFLAAVAKQAAIAIENALLHEELTEQERLKHELEIARRIQLASLPQETPAIGGLDISGLSIPALEVGGDYFDYLNGSTPGLTVIVGDVSGKGTSAALYMSKVQGMIRSLHPFNLSPKELFVRINELLYQDLEKKSFVTALGASIDTIARQVVLARAGHLPLFHYTAKTDKVEAITPRGLGLGLDAADVFAAEIEERTILYGKGDILLFVTDGITEAQAANGTEFGEARLSELLRDSCTSSAGTIRDRVISEVKAFTHDALPHDDQTIVVVKTR